MNGRSVHQCRVVSRAQRPIQIMTPSGNLSPVPAAASGAALSAYSHLARLCLRRLSLCLRVLLDLAAEAVFARWSRRRPRRGAAAAAAVAALPAMARTDLLAASATALADRIRRREVSSEELMVAVMRRIEVVQPVINAVIDHRFSLALESARRVDRILASVASSASPSHGNGRSAPSPPVQAEIAKETPLMGVPFSVGDGIKVKGLHHTLGLHVRASTVSPCDAECVRALQESGAVPVCATNTSELGGLWWGECANAVHGRTRNPYDHRRSVGGACGGGAALQCSSSVPFSLCLSDDGSLATSACFCGLFAHRATAGAVSIRGTGLDDAVNAAVATTTSMRSVGVAARHAEDLGTVLGAMAGQEKTNQVLKLDQQVFLTQLRFFYLPCPLSPSLSVSPVSPSVSQAMLSVVDFLEDNFGVSVAHIDFPVTDRPAEMARAAAAAGRASPIDELRRQEDESWNLWHQCLLYVMGRSRHTLPVLAAAVADSVSRVTTALSGGRKAAAEKESKAKEGLEELRRKMQTFLGSDGVLLCAAHPTPAPFNGQSMTAPGNVYYAGVFAALGLPATVAPVGTIIAGRENDQLPVGIQIVAGPYNDRLTLAVAKALERPFGGWNPPFKDRDIESQDDLDASFYCR